MKKKECPNPIIISSNMGIGNLVKETLSTVSYINPPFAFPAPKEKRKCISASAWMRPASARMQKNIKKRKFFLFFIFYFLIFPRVHADAVTGPPKRNQCLHGQEIK
jgi:hypothetical protein